MTPAEATERFSGAPMLARFNGTCAVCGQGIEPDTMIVFDRAKRRAAHLGCGVPERRGRR